MQFKDIYYAVPQESDKQFDFNGTTIFVKQYLPIQDKVQLIQDIVELASDDSTGCFSPARVYVYYVLVTISAYCDIDLDRTMKDTDLFDFVTNSHLDEKVFTAIPENEMRIINKLLTDTIRDIARFNNSFAGIIRLASNSAGDMDNSLADILKQLQDGENKEDLLQTLKTVVGND